VGSRAFAVAALLLCLSSCPPVEAQAPLPILRGIVVLPNGESRAYIEDAGTGHLAGYTVGEAVGDHRIAEIRDDRVVLGRGDEVVHLFMGGASATADQDLPASVAPVPSPTADVRPAPVIEGGAAWLEHLGIPAKGLSRAIERTPSKGSDNLDDD
jgi:hypothetical protein